MKRFILILMAGVLFSNCSSGSFELDLYDGQNFSNLGSVCPNKYYVYLHVVDCLDEPIEVQIDSNEYTRLTEIYDESEEACVEVNVDYIEGNATDGYYFDGLINLSTSKDEVFVIKNKCLDGDD
ncbi:hypothetical protein LRR18_15015 [Mangrovimonas sp. AS39]|uniref:hypothetical protein n=1 Tax=Mangrovimonas futianensis TaxID=2895523 RepID=UPI001E34F990|nr:hypothetical protein [Mangrovimonas futianensis]MCF1192904.1 hypothetical protein [Mangrovimonas futianensis]MCF1196494.1 hypothetical protein [Mangrovimonas futianensis]